MKDCILQIESTLFFFFFAFWEDGKREKFLVTLPADFMSLFL